MENPNIGRKELMHCNDILEITEYLGKSKYKGKFLNHPYDVEFYISNYNKKMINNPQIEEDEFIQKEWSQFCKDTIILTGRKRRSKNKGNPWEFEFVFKNHFYKGWEIKSHIKEGIVANPQIEKDEFINKEWLQHCNDTIILTGKKRMNKHVTEFEYIFKNHPYKGWDSKIHIVEGKVRNPQIEIDEFINKEWLQNCQDIIVLTGRTNGLKGNKRKFEYIFKKYYYKGWAGKSDIMSGKVLNPNSPYIYVSQEENTLRKFIRKSFLKLKTTTLEDYYEIDIYIPSLKIGFEYNGSYWHNKKEQEQPGYHSKKFNYFLEKGILIFNIWDYMWFQDKKHTIIREEMKEFIKTIIQNFSQKLLPLYF